MSPDGGSVFDLSPAEKLQLVEDLWDDLAASPEAVPVHDWQKEELARRKAILRAEKSDTNPQRKQGNVPLLTLRVGVKSIRVKYNLQSNPTSGLSWEEVKRRVRTRFAASLVLLGLCVSCCLGAEGKPEQIAKAKADEVVRATLKGDFGKLADLTYPKVVKLMGGRDKMIATIKSQVEDWKGKGYEFRSAKVGDPSPIVPRGRNLFTVLPMTLEMKALDGTLTIQGCLLGLSADKGKTWTFVNGDLADNERVKKVLPPLPETLKLPKKEKPVFKKDQ